MVETTVMTAIRAYMGVLESFGIHARKVVRAGGDCSLRSRS